MAAALHTVLSVALVGAAVALTVTGHDGTPAWAAFGAYIGGATVQTVAGANP